MDRMVFPSTDFLGPCPFCSDDRRFLMNADFLARPFFFLCLSLLLMIQAAALRAETHPRIEMQTSKGRIVVELYPDKAPKTVDNFMQYVREGFYANTLFHRVIDGFMIQGGGFDTDFRQKSTRDPIENEAGNGLKNKAGTLAMARTQTPHSATAQFFINLVDNPSLDYPSFDGWGYAVFGKVIEGFDVVQSIGKQRTQTQAMHQNVPAEPVVLLSITSIVEPATETRPAPAKR
jgi:cyclophilin family peptidyl-prolyl cis-trans isomerase